MSQQNKLKNIIFDFGGILIHVDYQLTERAFGNLIQKEFKFERLSEFERNFFDAYEMGKINTETFLWNIQHYYGKTLNPRDIIKAWNAMLRWKQVLNGGARCQLFVDSSSSANITLCHHTRQSLLTL